MLHFAVGALVLALAVAIGTGAVPWDVKGYLLRGWRLGVFTSAVLLVAASFLSAGLYLWRGGVAGLVRLVASWTLFGLVGLVTDLSVAGPGEPWTLYVVRLALLPVAVLLLVLHVGRRSRAWVWRPGLSFETSDRFSHVDGSEKPRK